MQNNYVISYPDDGTPQHNAVSGRWYVDFWEGKVYDKNDNATTLKRKLSDTGHEYIRSVLIYSSNAVKVNIGVTEGGAKTWTPPNGWTILKNIQVKNLVIELVEAVTPDEHALLIVGSTSPEPAYIPQVRRNFHTSDYDAAATGDAYATIFQKYVPAYDYNTFTLIESGGVNGLTFKVEGKMHSSETYVELQGDTAVAAGETAVVTIQGHYGWIRVQAKNTAAGNNAELTAEWGGSG